ncbi:MAG: helicase-related protein [Burkholderiales bacterium]
MPMPEINSPIPPVLHLPKPEHAQRVPADIPPHQVERLRQAAYTLPQVIKPGDYWDEPGPDAEAELDALGLILLQRAVPGSRPSRWIAPALMQEALVHLDAIGSGRGVLAQMNERSAALEALGIQRSGDGWERQAAHALVLPEADDDGADWHIPVHHLVPLDAAPVWAFYRSGEKGPLLRALQSAPPYADADDLAGHLVTLLRQAGDINPGRMDSLLPGLQSECSVAQPLAALKQACTRALDRWANRVNELDTLEDLSSELGFQGYPDTFPQARRRQRKITLLVGPPNSGKTYQAFERLATAASGAYLAPLRLLALEGRDRLAARGVACSLRTGEESMPVEGAKVVSSTIEMVNTRDAVEVAVIDEAQMIFDASRGWAWTQAIVAVPAEEVLIICSDYAVPVIESLLGLCGERCTVQRFVRKQHVQLMPAPIPLNALHKGDAIVAFSRREVLMLRDQVADQGKSVSVIYGALPPEVRRREAERFAQGETQVLVATDAIGMGLNLPIRRVLFSTLTKFDGVGDRTLDVSEVLQISGRAGRYGLHEEGYTGVLKEAEPTALRTLKELMAKEARAPRHFKAPVAPNWWHIDTISQRLGKTKLREVLGVFMDQLTLDNAHFQVAELEQMLDLAEQLDARAASLSLRERFIYAQAPVDTRTATLVELYLGWAEHHGRTGEAGHAWFLDDVDAHSRLERMEQALRACTLWLWLDLRFPGVYGQVAEVLELRNQLNDGIERQLKGKRPLWQSRGRPRRK